MTIRKEPGKPANWDMPELKPSDSSVKERIEKFKAKYQFNKPKNKYTLEDLRNQLKNLSAIVIIKNIKTLIGEQQQIPDDVIDYVCKKILEEVRETPTITFVNDILAEIPKQTTTETAIKTTLVKSFPILGYTSKFRK